VRKLILYIIAATVGLLLATLFVPGVRVIVFPDSSFFGVNLTVQWQIFLLLGVILGLLNYFVKPILEIISLPLEIITLGLFSFIINMALIWVLDVMFKELYVPLWLPLFYTSLIIWGLNFVLGIVAKKET